MRLKTCNAVCALVTMLALVVHVGYDTFAYLTFYYSPVLKVLTSRPFFACVCAHGAMGIWAVFFRGDGTRMGLYQKQNWRTIVQRIAAILIAPLLIVHRQTFNLLQGTAANERWVAFALVLGIQLAFYAVVATHTALSFSRALITLGLLNSREKQKRLDRLVAILCAIGMLAAATVVVRGQLAMFLLN